MGAVVSLDGLLAGGGDTAGLFVDWFCNGEVEQRWTEEQAEPRHTTQASRGVLQEVSPGSGAMVLGRRPLNPTDGWGGVPPTDEHVLAITSGDGEPSIAQEDERTSGGPTRLTTARRARSQKAREHHPPALTSRADPCA